MTKKLFWIVLASLALVVLVAAILLYSNQPDPSFHGSQITPPMPAKDFTLTSQNANPISLSDFRGKFILLFFGYTNCPDECPAAMGALKLVKNQLKDQADKIQVLFVTTDPARDNPQALGNFLNNFDSTFIGLTGTQTELEPVWSDYGVTVEDNGETHSSRIYLINPEGNIPLIYLSDTSPADITADLTHLLKEN
jgi:protein SCO1/2